MASSYSSNIPVAQRLDQQPWFFYLSGIILSAQPVIAMGISEGLLGQGHSLFIYTTKDFLNGKELLIISPWLVFCIEALFLSIIVVAFSIRMVRPIRYSKARRLAPSGAAPDVGEVQQAQDGVAQKLPGQLETDSGNEATPSPNPPMQPQ
jgi:hypothetical protein